ncbi:Alg14-domain-containing protein [Violaceomyces palustris]|uniref:Alg14-domain-containing protein n=1 Tax=Violaceomyces palustris TaxID=1673888 RepID=A0ACD0NM79_9BASI|nr:Alg14-domain-containing protein [Violaceomyces palustris]
MSWVGSNIRRFIDEPIHETLKPSLLLYLIPPLPSRGTIITLITILVAILTRILFILPDKHTRQSSNKNSLETRRRKSAVRVAAFLGSGGHTSELLILLSALPKDRYNERIYLYSSGDHFSSEKARRFEESVPSSYQHASPTPARKNPSFQCLEIPRARAVHQSFFSTPLSLAYSLFFCLDRIALRPLADFGRKDGDVDEDEDSRSSLFADLIIMNGPGTCVPIVAAVYFLRFFGLPSPQLLYVESFARVRSLSLTAKLVRRFVDRFVVQWPEAIQGSVDDARTVCRGWLV